MNAMGHSMSHGVSRHTVILSVTWLFVAVSPGLGETVYVSPDGAHLAPYSSWTTAATNIQDAISKASDGDTVLVADGTYDSGGKVVHADMMNRVALTRPIIVRSVNGPETTLIVGSGPPGDTAVRCAYVGMGARLEGFTLTGGRTQLRGSARTERTGAGAYCEPGAVVANCIITDNVAEYVGGGTYRGAIENCILRDNFACHGGGAFDSSLRSCVVSENAAKYVGGGTAWCTVENSTVAMNSAAYGGGGIWDSFAQNCIVYGNSSTYNEANCRGGEVQHSCTTPDPGGVGNITDDPQFADADASDFRLLPTSPCIDAGINENWMPGATDVEGCARLVGGTTDMGACEWPHGDCVVDVKANGQDEFTVVASGQPLSITGRMAADPAMLGDTWILALTSHPFPDNLFCCDLNGNAWVRWVSTLYGPSAQGAIPYLCADTLLESSELSGGLYLFFLGCDAVENRWIDFDSLEIDSVAVFIAE